MEVGPLALFFVVNARADIFYATFAFMIATVASLGYAYFNGRHIPAMPLIAGAFILVFGGLTLILQDDTFIKLKPTIVNALFATALFVGLALRKNLFKIALQGAIHLDEGGWRKLTWRWAFFFLFLALANEYVWRTQTTNFWVDFKVFGVMPLTVLFSALQLPLIMRHQIDDPGDAEPSQEAQRNET
ncbi:intracellular septation protein [Varunaivibrio sulfuroxidans]|uniref:Inner membrane-spanning protein YciB n=2 Tax=Varunaivibrio sulfuroxidans TaxID=1773489 RepID=A0A4R3JAJ4_9PROT|nr:intracellular septation protein [Varunaivibrio sulfuroxidans]